MIRPARLLGELALPVLLFKALVEKIRDFAGAGEPTRRTPTWIRTRRRASARSAPAAARRGFAGFAASALLHGRAWLEWPLSKIQATAGQTARELGSRQRPGSEQPQQRQFRFRDPVQAVRRPECAWE